MNAWQALRWTLRSVLLDKGPVLPAVAGVIVYCFFYPLPYSPEAVLAADLAMIALRSLFQKSEPARSSLRWLSC